MLADLLARVLAPWQDLANTPVLVRQHSRRLNDLEERMTSTEDAWGRAATIIGLVRAEVASLRDQLATEDADDQAQVDTAVTAARQSDADRLAQLVDALAEVLPADVPDVPTPGPGEPATDPGTGESSDDVVGGSSSVPDSGGF